MIDYIRDKDTCLRNSESLNPDEVIYQKLVEREYRLQKLY